MIETEFHLLASIPCLHTMSLFDRQWEISYMLCKITVGVDFSNQSPCLVLCCTNRLTKKEVDNTVASPNVPRTDHSVPSAPIGKINDEGHTQWKLTSRQRSEVIDEDDGSNDNVFDDEITFKNHDVSCAPYMGPSIPRFYHWFLVHREKAAKAIRYSIDIGSDE